jgi:hypothetical protein
MTVGLFRSNHLYLTQAEVDRLANAIHQELICRTTTQVNDPVIVADISLTVVEAWELLDRLKDSIEEIVDWVKEGF